MTFRVVPFSLIVLLMLAPGCQQKKVSADEIQKYIADPGNGLTKSEAVGDYLVEVAYKPSDLLVSQELSRLGEIDSVEISKLKDKYRHYHYFIMSLSANGREALQKQNQPEMYSDLVNTLSFQMGQYVTLTGGQDTVDVADYHMDRTYGQAEATNFIFAFEQRNTLDAEALTFHLGEFGMGLGNQKFTFETADIRRLPMVDFTRAVGN